MRYSLLLLFCFVIHINCVAHKGRTRAVSTGLKSTRGVSKATALSYRDVITEEWEAFKLKYNKQYKDKSEEYFRLKVFMENKHFIAKHNQKAANGEKSYTLGMNEFGDLLHHEFVSIMNGLKLNIQKGFINGSTYLSPKNVVIPDSVDWRTEGYVTEVKNQGQCGSCWAFSATGSLEGQHYRKSGILNDLSEQNLIDCSTGYGNAGCEGGWMDYAFQYVEENQGIDTEGSYPYEAMDDSCRYNPGNTGATDTGFVDIPSGNEQALQEAVATIGPISVGIDASQASFQSYSGGVYDEEQCSTQVLDHGVLVVGYGTTPDNEDYWIVKNSWGESWGENGYIRMSRNKENQCGIATKASYPLV